MLLCTGARCFAYLLAYVCLQLAQLNLFFQKLQDDMGPAAGVMEVEYGGGGDSTMASG